VSATWVEAVWPAPGGVRALSTFRSGGVSAGPYASLNLGGHVGDVPAAVAENRRRLVTAAGLPAEPVWLRQVHGITVADLDAVAGRDAAGDHGAGADRDAATDRFVAADQRAAAELGATDLDAPAGLGPADAAFTRRRGRVCAILTADCLPIVLAADSGDLVAAVHAGWKGLAGGVIEVAVRALAVPPERLMAWLGPAIGPEHFEVGGEVREALLKGDPGAAAAFARNERGRFMADLGKLGRRRLAALGVDRIYGGGQCTYADGDRYFSHRRDGVTGRQATLIWLESGRQ
jgi:YfiH family protein